MVLTQPDELMAHVYKKLYNMYYDLLRFAREVMFFDKGKQPDCR